MRVSMILLRFGLRAVWSKEQHAYEVDLTKLPKVPILLPAAPNQIWAGAPNQWDSSKKNESICYNSPD